MTTALDLTDQLGNYLVRTQHIRVGDTPLFNLGADERKLLNRVLEQIIHHGVGVTLNSATLRFNTVCSKWTHKDFIFAIESLFENHYEYYNELEYFTQSRYLPSFTILHDKWIKLELNVDFIPFVEQQRELINVYAIM